MATRLAVLTAAILLLALPAAAHTIVYRALDGGGVALEFRYSDGEAVAYEPFVVIGPNDRVDFQNGRTDRHGRVTFLPDRPGAWQVTVDAGEGEGHRVTAHVTVDDGGAVAPDPPWQRWLLIASLGGNVALGFAAYFLGRRRVAATA